MGLNTGVVDIGHLGEVSLFISLVRLADDLLLVGVKGQQVTFLLGVEGLVASNTGGDLFGKDGHQGVIFEGHNALSEANKGRLESGLLDSGCTHGVSERFINFGEGTFADTIEEGLKVGHLVSLDAVEHGAGTAVEVVLKVSSRVGQEVNKGSLLNEVVLLVETNVFHLFLGMNKVSHLLLFTNIGPVGAELLQLVLGVNVVEDGELGTGQPMEVTDLSPTEVETDQELVMENHTSDPLVVGPATELGNGGDGSNVSEQEDETTTGTGEGLVMRGNVLGTDSLEQGLHVVVVGVNKRRLLRVVGVLVTRAHLGKFFLVVTLSVFLLVLGWMNGLST